MSESFENDAAPLIKSMMWGEPRGPLSAGETLVLARWLAKTSALLALYRVYAPNPAYFRVSEKRCRDLREMVTTMTKDRALLPSHVINRIGLIDPSAQDTLDVYVPRGAYNAVGPDWLSNFHPMGLLVTQTWIFTDKSGDADRYRFMTKRDPRMILLDGGSTGWPPRERISTADAERMRRELGHSPQNVVGGGWQVIP